MLPDALKAISGSKEVLTELYKDLAQPGVRQVGKAFETIVETGALALLPLRWLNLAASQWDKMIGNMIAARFARIDEDRVQPLLPEVAVPILERLTYTSDVNLRQMFIELLASNADCEYSNICHPSFVQIISGISPDEAKLLNIWRDVKYIPFLEIRNNVRDGSYEIIDEINDIPDCLDIPQQINVYLNNLSGLGLIRREPDEWSSDDIYKTIINKAEGKYEGIKSSPEQENQVVFIDEGEISYYKRIYTLTEYGALFQKACLPKDIK